MRLFAKKGIKGDMTALTIMMFSISDVSELIPYHSDQYTIMAMQPVLIKSATVILKATIVLYYVTVGYFSNLVK